MGRLRKLVALIGLVMWALDKSTDQSEEAPREPSAVDTRRGAASCECDRASEAALLKEYEMSTLWIAQREAIAWQMMAAVPAAALAGVGVVVVNFWRLGLFFCSAALLVIVVLLCLWLRAQERWREFITVHNFRRHQIERELRLCANRYVDWSDTIADSPRKLERVDRQDDGFQCFARWLLTPTGDPCWQGDPAALCSQELQERIRSAGNLAHPRWSHESRRWIIRITMAASLVALTALWLYSWVTPGVWVRVASRATPYVAEWPAVLGAVFGLAAVLCLLNRLAR